MPLRYLKDGTEIGDLKQALEGVQAGVATQITIQVKNDLGGNMSKASLNPFEDSELKIIDYPKALRKGEVGNIVIEATPDYFRERGFREVLQWRFEVD